MSTPTPADDRLALAPYIEGWLRADTDDAANGWVEDVARRLAVSLSVDVVVPELARLREEIKSLRADLSIRHNALRDALGGPEAGGANEPTRYYAAIEQVHQLRAEVRSMVVDLHAAQFDGATSLPDRPLDTVWKWLLDLVRKDRALLSGGNTTPADAATGHLGYRWSAVEVAPGTINPDDGELLAAGWWIVGMGPDDASEPAVELHVESTPWVAGADPAVQVARSIADRLAGWGSAVTTPEPAAELQANSKLEQILEFAGGEWCEQCKTHVSGSHYHCAKCGQRSSMLGHSMFPCPPARPAVPAPADTPVLPGPDDPALAVLRAKLADTTDGVCRCVFQAPNPRSRLRTYQCIEHRARGTEGPRIHVEDEAHVDADEMAPADTPATVSADTKYLCPTHWASYLEGHSWWDEKCQRCDHIRARRILGPEAPPYGKRVFVVDARSGMRSVARNPEGPVRHQYRITPTPASPAGGGE